MNKSLESAARVLEPILRVTYIVLNIRAETNHEKTRFFWFIIYIIKSKQEEKGDRFLVGNVTFSSWRVKL